MIAVTGWVVIPFVGWQTNSGGTQTNPYDTNSYVEKDGVRPSHARRRLFLALPMPTPSHPTWRTIHAPRAFAPVWLSPCLPAALEGADSPLSRVQALVPKELVQHEREIRPSHKLEDDDGEYSMRPNDYE